MTWWPGRAYVTWVGIDGYYYRPSDTFANVFGNTITQVRIFTDKPILLSETAVGPAADQFAKIQDLFDGMRQVQDARAGVVRHSPDGSIFHQDWRLADNPFAQISFRLGVRQELAPYHPIG